MWWLEIGSLLFFEVEPFDDGWYDLLRRWLLLSIWHIQQRTLIFLFLKRQVALDVLILEVYLFLDDGLVFSSGF